MPEQPDEAREVVSRWLADYTGWWQPKSADHVASDEFGAAADNLLAALAAHVVPKQDVLSLHLSSVVAGDFCTECGHAWPCATARLVAGGES